MSTKIFTGFAFSGRSLEDTVVLLGRQKNTIQALVDRKNTHLMARLCANLIDRFCLARAGVVSSDAGESDDFKNHSALSKVWDEVLERQKKCRESLYRDPAADCDVLLRLFYDFASGRIVGLCVEEQVGAYKHLLAQEGVVDFSYWNNVDPPQDVPANEWRHRETVWNCATDQGGFEMRMQWEPGLPHAEEVAAMLPELEQRINAHADDICEQEYFKANWAPKRPGDCSGLFACHNRYRNEVATEGGPWHARLTELRQQIGAVLRPDLTSLLTCDFEGVPAV